MAPFLVIEDEARVGPAAEIHLAAGECQALRRRRTGDICPYGWRIAQVLECHPPRLDVHQFVIETQFGEVGDVVVESAAQAACHGNGNLVRVVVDCCRLQQGQVPADVVRHAGRIVEGVGTTQQAGATRAVRSFAQAPALLEPDDMPVFPQRRIQMAGTRPQPAVRRQRLDELAQPLARLRQAVDELRGGIVSDGSGSVHVI